MKARLNLVLFTLLIIFLNTCIVSAENYPLRILNIDGTSSNNRIRFAYPGLLYDVRIVAEGGVYPYIWSLENGPIGMEIDAATGIVTWSAPVNGTYTVTVKVRDLEGNTDSSSYKLIVTDDPNRFHFVDAINGKTVDEGGTGTLNNPWRSMSDFYHGKWDSTYSGDIIYFREGTYTLPKIDASAGRAGSYRIWLESGHPIAFLSYPGENVVFNCEGDGNSGYHFFLDSGISDIYFYGITFENVWSYGFEIGSCDYLTIYKCHFKNFNTIPESGHNQGYLTYFGTDSTSDFNVIVNNIFGQPKSNGIYGTVIKTYGVYHSIFEDNIINASMHEGISLKDHSNYNTIRHNELKNCDRGIVIQGYGGCSNNEILFNYIFSNGYAGVYIVNAGSIGTTYFIRNTIVGNFYFRAVDQSDGPFYISHNVIVNSDPADHIRDDPSEHYSIDANRSQLDGNLLGLPQDNIVDNNGFLTTVYNNYLHTCGWQITGGGSPPDPPTLHPPN